MSRTFAHLFLVSALASPLPAVAVYHDVGAPGRSELAPGRQRAALTAVSPTPTAGPDASVSSPLPGFGRERRAAARGKLGRPEHAVKLERVQGLMNGMTNKLTNLSARLDRHLQNFERRIETLRAAGHVIDVGTELENARSAVTEAKTAITSIVTALNALPDSEDPRVQAREVRTLIRSLRTSIQKVRTAFQELRLAIRSDVRASLAASPSPSPTPIDLSSTPSPFTFPTPTP